MDCRSVFWAFLIWRFIFFSQDNNHNDTSEEFDKYAFSEDEEIDYVDFVSEGEYKVLIPKVTITDHFLTKLCIDHALYRGYIHEHVPCMNNREVVEVPNDVEIVPRFKIKKSVITLSMIQQYLGIKCNLF